MAWNTFLSNDNRLFANSFIKNDTYEYLDEMEDEEVIAVEDPNEGEDDHDHEKEQVVLAVDDDERVGHDLQEHFEPHGCYLGEPHCEWNTLSGVSTSGNLLFLFVIIVNCFRAFTKLVLLDDDGCAIEAVEDEQRLEELGVQEVGIAFDDNCVEQNLSVK
jgi:hypothetical protein